MLTRLLLFLFYASTWARASVEPSIVEVAQDLTTGKPLSAPWTVACWNIEWFPGQRPTKSSKTSEKKQIRAVKEIYLQEKPTILFATEVRSLEQLKRLRLTNVSLACTQIPRTKEEGLLLPNQGLALISQVPWKKVWALDFSKLTPGMDRPYRGILGAEFIDASGKSFYLYGVHLKSNRGDARSNRMRRERAMLFLRWDWKRLKLDPQKDRIMIVGDFNTSLTLPAYAQERTLRNFLQEGFVDATEGMSSHERVTLPKKAGSPFPPADFDQMILSPAFVQEWKTAMPWAQVIPVSESASDHSMMKIALP